MSKILFETLHNAYCSEDPFAYLQETVKNKDFGVYYTNQMLPKRTTEGENPELKEEIESYRNTDHELSSDVTLKYIYCYFGTSICHLFGKFNNDLSFYPSSSRAVIVYSPIKPNEPIPYLWFDVSKKGDHVTLVKQKNIHSEYVKVKLSTGYKVYISLKSKKSMLSSKGNFIEICMPEGNVTGPYTKQDCVILVTIDGRFINIYYRQSRCFVACHPI